MLGHWSAIAGAVQPPTWSGPVRVHVLSDEDPSPIPRAKPGPKPGTDAARRPAAASVARRVTRAEVKELQQLQRRAAESVLQVLPAWSLIEPGSAKERLMLMAPAALWWPEA